MKKYILLLSFLFVFIFCNAYGGVLPSSSEGSISTKGNKGNQTIVNVEKGDKELEANEDKAYKESQFTITADILPFTMLSGMGGRQFSQESFMVGFLYKNNEHWQLVGEWANLIHKSIDDTEYKSTHYMYGAGLRWTIGAELNQQIQLNAGMSTSEITRNGESVDAFEDPVWGEIKYLWCSDNTAWGLKIQAMDIPNKADTEEEYRNYGYVIVSFNFEVGLPE